MDQNSQMQELAKRIIPVMQEYGLSAFVIAGYFEDGEGGIKRGLIVNTQRNPAFEDGLRPIIQIAAIWGATPQAGNRPWTEQSSSSE